MERTTTPQGGRDTSRTNFTTGSKISHCNSTNSVVLSVANGCGGYQARECISFPGKFTHHLRNWQMITPDQWVVNSVKGYEIDWWRRHHRLKHQENLCFHYWQDASVSQTGRERQQEVCSKTTRRLRHFQFVNLTLDSKSPVTWPELVFSKTEADCFSQEVEGLAIVQKAISHGQQSATSGWVRGWYWYLLLLRKSLRHSTGCDHDLGELRTDRRRTAEKLLSGH